MSYSGNIKINPIESDLISSDQFDPSQFFIPGWKGEGLITSHGLQIKSILSNLTIDASSLFKKSCPSTNHMRKLTHDEFLSYCDWVKLDKSLFITPNDFWFHFQDDSSPYQETVREFVKVFCFRAVAIYLFRIKFILQLSKELHIELTEDNFFNPLSFLSKIFKKNSSTELFCESLQINQYSWYRPTSEYRESVLKLKDAFQNVTLTELIKLLSTPKEYKIYSVKNYSHSISHLDFGLFINDLLLKFPKWLEPKSDNKTLNSNDSHNASLLPNTINTLFEGNHTSSIALSHWLAQETNVLKSEWDNIICPNFKGNDFIDGTFLKICQELQFLSFLTKVAVTHNYELVPFLCKIMKEKNSSTPDDLNGQVSILDLVPTAESQSFNRIVLNLIEQPKVNPHHHLVTQILSKTNILKKDAYLFVFTNQKLFVPSHSDRVELLLKDFKVQAMFNFDQLKGKGEIPNFLYVLTRREAGLKSGPHFIKLQRKEKEACLNFDFKGNLGRFNLFSKFLDELNLFLSTKRPGSTPIYINDLSDSLSFEFHTDAIIEGKLVSSTVNKDHTQMAHPSFFKNLTKTCVPLDTFFHIDNINSGSGQEKSIASELLGIKTGLDQKFQLLLIVNQSNPMEVEIELFPIESLKAKLEEYGTAFHSYFGLSSKLSDINLNVFREYFNSSFGNQIIQMQLTDGPAKLKGKLRGLLVPHFFSETNFMPSLDLVNFDFLETDTKTLLTADPKKLIDRMQFIESKVDQFKSQYPWHLLSLLSLFKISLKDSIFEIESNKVDEYQFKNPTVSSKLIKLKTYPIYPKNEDVFIELLTSKTLDLKDKLSGLKVKAEEDSYSLILKSENRDVVSIHANKLVIHFLKYIFNIGIGHPIDQLLMGIQIPKASELEEVINCFTELKECKESLLKKCESLILRIFQDQITR